MCGSKSYFELGVAVGILSLTSLVVGPAGLHSKTYLREGQPGGKERL